MKNHILPGEVKRELERQVDKYLADLETGPDLFAEDQGFLPAGELSMEPRKESR